MNGNILPYVNILPFISEVNRSALAGDKTMILVYRQVVTSMAREVREDSMSYCLGDRPGRFRG